MTFTPQLQFINSITLGQQTLVGFVSDHDYIVGEIISFRISPPFGTKELNNQQGLITASAPTTVLVNIDSTNYTPFVYPVSGPYSPPITVPSSSGITPGSNPPTVTLQCPFDDVPPP
jgi:hypothetical protein